MMIDPQFAEYIFRVQRSSLRSLYTYCCHRLDIKDCLGLKSEASAVVPKTCILSNGQKEETPLVTKRHPIV